MNPGDKKTDGPQSPQWWQVYGSGAPKFDDIYL